MEMFVSTQYLAHILTCRHIPGRGAEGDDDSRFLEAGFT